MTTRTATADLDRLPASLLSTGNPKTAKGEGYGYLTAILHLAPAALSGRNVCAWASEGCRAACLNTAGRGGIGLDADGLNTIQVARIRRTRWLRSDRDAFLARLVREIGNHVRNAERHGLRPAVRLNGTSDLPWERIPVTVDGVDYANVFRAFPDVRFYDYTKFPARLRGERGTGQLPPNYSLTFSLSDRADSAGHALDWLEAGASVAVVFATRKGADLPDAWQLAEGDGSGAVGRFAPVDVIDGDAHDLRFLDPAGVVVGLRAKGRARHDRSGFVRAA